MTRSIGVVGTNDDDHEELVHNRALWRLAWRQVRRHRARNSAVSAIVFLAMLVSNGAVGQLSVLELPILAAVVAVTVGAATSSDNRSQMVRLGQLRATGASPRQLARLVYLEAGLPALLGVVLALSFASAVMGLIVVSDISDLGVNLISRNAGLVVRVAIAQISNLIAVAIGVALACNGQVKRARRLSIDGALAGHSPPLAGSSSTPPMVLATSKAITVQWTTVVGVAAVALVLYFASGSPNERPLPYLIAAALACYAVLVSMSLRRFNKPPRGIGVVGRAAWKDLGRNPERTRWQVLSTTGLAALAIMAASGIESDRDQRVPLDSNFIVLTAGTYHSDGDSSATIKAELDRLTALIKQQVPITRQVDFETLESRPYLTTSSGHQLEVGGYGAVIVTPELAQALELASPDLDALNQGAALANPYALLAHRPDDVTATLKRPGSLSTIDAIPIHAVGPESKARGGRQFSFLIGPGLTQQVATTANEANRLLITEQPLSPDHKAWLAQPKSPSAWSDIQFSRQEDALDQLSTKQLMGLAIGILALFIVIVARAQASKLMADTQSLADGLVAGGRTHRVHQRLVATQTFMVSILGGLNGSIGGILLFRLVTMGDDSVPYWIVPWPAIAVTVVAVPSIAAATVTLTTRNPNLRLASDTTPL